MKKLRPLLLLILLSSTALLAQEEKTLINLQLNDHLNQTPEEHIVHLLIETNSPQFEEDALKLDAKIKVRT